MVSKVISAVLIFVILYMGVKQGFAMVSGKPEMLRMLGELGFDKKSVQVFGVITLLSTILIVFPKTFVWGTF